MSGERTVVVVVVVWGGEGEGVLKTEYGLRSKNNAPEIGPDPGDGSSGPAEAPAVQMRQLPVGVGGLAVAAGQAVWIGVVPGSGVCREPSESAVHLR